VKKVCSRGHLLAVTKALGRSRLYASFVYCINGRLEEKRKEEEKGKKNSMGFFLLITSSCVCHRDASQRCGPAQDISNSTVELLWQYSHAASSTFSFSTFSVHVITIETTTQKNNRRGEIHRPQLFCVSTVLDVEGVRRLCSPSSAHKER
jgi:hypothetical protein